MIPKYSGSLTGEPIMLYETRIVANKLLQDKTEQQIRNEILDSNEFGYKTKKSIPKRVNSILRRLKNLDKGFLKIINDDLSGDGKVVVIYAISLENRLFSELIAENVSYKLLTKDVNYSKKDIIKFINTKAEMNDKIASYKEYTIYRMAVSIFNILKEAGIIEKSGGTSYLVPINVSYKLREMFQNINKLTFLENLGGRI